MIKPRFRTSVIWKTVVLFSLICILPLFVFISYIYSLVMDEVTDNAQDSMNQSLQKTAATARQTIDRIEKSCAELSGDNILTRFIDIEYSSTGNEIIHFNKTVYPFLSSRRFLLPEVDSIWVFTSNASVPQSWADGAGIAPLSAFNMSLPEQPTKTEYWWDTSGVRVSYPTNDTDSQHSFFSFNHILRSPSSGWRTGIASYRIAADALFGAVVEPENNTSGTLYLVNRDGLVLHSADLSAIGQNVTAFYSDPPQSFISVAAGRHQIGEQVFLVHSESFPQLGCSLVAVQSLAGIHNEIRSITTKMIVVLVLSGLFIVLLISAATLRILKRLRLLVAAMNRVDDGEHHDLVDPGPNDEFGQLIATYNQMVVKTKELINNVYRAQIKEKEAQIRALEAQVNPHFLYNTLTSIAFVAKEKDDHDAYRMALSLGKFYRLGLSRNAEMISVADELEYLNMYLTIQKIRFKERIDYRFQIDERYLACKLIRNVLQPLVENAISHGLEDKKEGGIVTVSMWPEQANLVFCVQDNGVGIAPALLKDFNEGQFDHLTPKGYGLKNVNERLQLYYGEAYRLYAESSREGGTRMYIRMPIRW